MQTRLRVHLEERPFTDFAICGARLVYDDSTPFDDMEAGAIDLTMVNCTDCLVKFYSDLFVHAS